MTMDKIKILVINPGSTSTKLACFENDVKLWQEEIGYEAERLKEFQTSVDQVAMRKEDVLKQMACHDLSVSELAAIAARGGPFKPLKSGTYAVTEAVVDDVRHQRVRADHISNIAVLMAYELGQCCHTPAYFVDPVCVDEFEPLARYSGFAGIERQSLLHALNIKAVARQTALDLGRPLAELNLIVNHLGGGISICAMKQGCMVDVNNANEEGPFSPERAGTVPASSLAKYIFSHNKSYPEIKKQITGLGGLAGLLGTSDLRDVEARIFSGDGKAREVLQAMAYQIAKEIGAMAAVLQGKVDGIVFTGGGARCQLLINWIDERIAFIGPVRLYPGEKEMEALAAGVLRVLRGEEKVKIY